jgi:hypothetical protein
MLTLVIISEGGMMTTMFLESAQDATKQKENRNGH